MTDFPQVQSCWPLYHPQGSPLVWSRTQWWTNFPSRSHCYRDRPDGNLAWKEIERRETDPGFVSSEGGSRLGKSLALARWYIGCRYPVHLSACMAGVARHLKPGLPLKRRPPHQAARRGGLHHTDYTNFTSLSTEHWGMVTIQWSWEMMEHHGPFNPTMTDFTVHWVLCRRWWRSQAGTSLGPFNLRLTVKWPTVNMSARLYSPYVPDPWTLIGSSGSRKGITVGTNPCYLNLLFALPKGNPFQTLFKLATL